MRNRIVAITVPAVVCLAGCFVKAVDPAGASDQPAVFARDIQPLLAKHCLLCHGPDEAEAGLRLDVAEQAYAKLESGARAIVPGDAEASELLRRVAATDEFARMPPEGEPLSADQIALLRGWITAGAKYEQHWAYRPVMQPALPPVNNESWGRGPIDRFVLARLEQAGISPSPQADRATLIKRLYYDLVGLPPTPDEVDAFESDDRPDAYERLVDQLLDSEHFGERWGRHWLDKARYADSDGYEKDRPRPNAWRYRDWVIDAINRDMPFDQFTIEQLAGDLLPEASPMQKLATAFHRQTLTNTEGGVDQEEFRVEATFDRTETTGSVWMALTLICARCHSHKYDQIPQREYYQLFAFFNNTNEANLELAENEKSLARYHEQKAEHDAKVVRLEEQLAEAKAKLQPQTDASEDETIAKLAAELAELKKNAPKPPTVSVAVMAPANRQTRILHRGDFLQPGEDVNANALAVIQQVHPLQSRRGDGPADRLDLARWLVDPNHPLTSRVTVNHVWAHLFGRGIVPTVNDFGVRGEAPTHPELLDWLAWHFPRDMGWSRKTLIKTIVTSAIYRQSSHHRPQLQEIDPTNRLLARQNRLRVEAEIIRDLHLAASGLLSEKIGGPSVFPPLPSGVAELSYANNFKWKTSEGEDRYRRGMYTFFKRTSPHPTLVSFDCPDSNTTKLQRDTSNTPLQALATLNNEVFTEAAQAMARRVLSDGGDSDVERLTYALRLCIARKPDAAEIGRFENLMQSARDYYAAHPEDAKAATQRHAANEIPQAENAAWVATLRMVMNLDEFIVRD